MSTRVASTAHSRVVSAAVTAVVSAASKDVMSGVVAALLPQDMVHQVFGAGSGMAGVALVAMAGALVPGGPAVAFAVGAAAVKARTGGPVLRSFVSARCIFSLTRSLTHETAMLGWPFLRHRLPVSWPVALVIGGSCLALDGAFGLG